MGAASLMADATGRAATAGRTTSGSVRPPEGPSRAPGLRDCRDGADLRQCGRVAALGVTVRSASSSSRPTKGES